VIKIGVFAKTFAGTTPMGVLRAARQAGYEAVQYNMACSGLSSLPLAVDRAAADAVRKASRATGVDIAAVSATYNMIHPVVAEREKGRRAFEAIAAVAHRIGTRLLTVCSGSRDAEDQWRKHPHNATSAAWREMCEEFRLLVAIAEKHDVLIGVEPELANVVDSAAKAREMIEMLASQRIRIVLDPANLFEVGPAEQRRALIQGAVDLLADRIELAHAKDRYADGRFAAAGDGVVDFHHFLAALRKAGFRGALVTHGLVASEAERVSKFLRSELEATGGRN
jgi:sugar phosphate isomerase/epimerase